MPAPFRQSRYVDFNTGVVLERPMDFVGQPLQSIADRFERFERRVEVWQLGPAVAMLRLNEASGNDSIWRHSAYAMIAVFVSYFEMIGKVLNPDADGRTGSGDEFLMGLADVYPSLDRLVAVEFRDRVRNGLYHLGYTKNGLAIWHPPAEVDDISVQVETGTGECGFYVEPHLMLRTIVEHFPAFVARLRAGDAALERQFVKFFDRLHQ